MSEIGKKVCKFFRKDFLFFIIFMIFFISIYIVRPVDNLDELWNYNFAKQITEGLIPYKDISMIITPLSSFLASIFLNISNELLTMRILGIILSTAIFYMIYRILKQLTGKEEYSLICTLIMMFLISGILSYDYNNLLVLFILIALAVELFMIKKQESQKLRKLQNLLIGLISGLVILTKQSIGVIFTFAMIIYPLININETYKFKNYLKEIIYRIIGLIIPCLLFIIYLIFTDSYSEFISYTILGIGTFNNKIPFSHLFKIDFITKIMAILVLFTIVALVCFIIIRLVKRTKEKELIAIFLYGMSLMMMIIPICDKNHFYLASLIIFIGLAYLFLKFYRYMSNKKVLKNESLKIFIKNFIKCLTYGVLIILFFGTIICNSYNYAIDSSKNNQIKHYKDIVISDNLKHRIEEVDYFIVNQEQDGYRTYILDSEAVVYMIPLDKYSKNYDMFLNGNFGKDGTKGILKDILELRENSKAKFLVRNPKYSYNWQLPVDIINYVRENFEKVDSISIFDVYE